jgi:hypothetical protein
MKPVGTGTIKGERYEVFRDKDKELSIQKIIPTKSTV